mgnify:CR=1 FL=1
MSVRIAEIEDPNSKVLKLGAELSQETDRSEQLADSAGVVLWELDVES